MWSGPWAENRHRLRQVGVGPGQDLGIISDVIFGPQYCAPPDRVGSRRCAAGGDPEQRRVPTLDGLLTHPTAYLELASCNASTKPV